MSLHICLKVFISLLAGFEGISRWGWFAYVNGDTAS
jgi:hypothetical protein